MYIDSINFSLWCDFLEREFIQTKLVELKDSGIVNGVTSNPAIFKSAFLNSKFYLEQKQALAKKSAKEIYEALAISDIKATCDLFMDNFKSGDDGFVSIEVDPLMCDDTKATIQEGRRLFKEINKPNLMIKIPATKAGYEATRVLMSEGINVNSTLIFSNSQSQSVCEAMQEGMNEAALKGFKPRGVVSIFVSRFDKKADDKLNGSELKSKLGILNATYIYNNIQKFGIKT